MAKGFPTLVSNTLFVQNSSTTIVTGSSSAIGRPSLSPRIEVDGLHRSPPHVPAMAEPAKASPLASAPASAQAKPATVFHFTGTCLLHKLLSDGTVELINNAGANQPHSKPTYSMTSYFFYPRHTSFDGHS